MPTLPPLLMDLALARPFISLGSMPPSCAVARRSLSSASGKFAASRNPKATASGASRLDRNNGSNIRLIDLLRQQNPSGLLDDHLANVIGRVVRCGHQGILYCSIGLPTEDRDYRQEKGHDPERCHPEQRQLPSLPPRNARGNIAGTHLGRMNQLDHRGASVVVI